jgi:hypothetical protein
MRRHLPLVRGPETARGEPGERLRNEPGELAGNEPRELSRRAVRKALAIADTTDGSEALNFARSLAAALAARGDPITLLCVGYDRAPSLPDALRERLAPVSAHATTLDDLALPESFALLVGVAAVAAFAPPLSILIGVGRPLSAWQAELRRLRASFGLELAEPRDAVARALAERLLQGGFLR